MDLDGRRLKYFIQYLTEQEWDHEYLSRRGPAHKIVPYMSGPKEDMVPIMTNSESILQFGNNAYGKPATALNILRETVMGRDLLIMPLRNTVAVGPLHPHLQIFSVQWKMPLVLILIGTGGDGSTLPIMWTSP